MNWPPANALLLLLVVMRPLAVIVLAEKSAPSDGHYDDAERRVRRWPQQLQYGQQQQPQTQPHPQQQQSGLYAQFDRKLEQLGEYARDRLDTSRGQSRWHRQDEQPLQAHTIDAADSDSDSESGRRRKRRRIVRTKQSSAIVSAVAAIANAAAASASRSSESEFVRTDKVLRVLEPDADDDVGDDVGGDNNTNPRQRQHENCNVGAPDVIDGIERLDANQRQRQSVQEFRQQQQQQQQPTDYDSSAAVADEFIIANACELCPEQPDTAGGRRKQSAVGRCCDGSGSPATKSKRHAAGRTSPHEASAVYPAVVVKTSPDLSSYKRLMQRDDGRHSPPAAVADHYSYADFLNYLERPSTVAASARPGSGGLAVRTAANYSMPLPMPNGAEQLPAGTSGRLSTAATTTTAATTATSTAASDAPAVVVGDCAKYLDADNSSAAVLQRVLDELQHIRAEKSGTATPEGAPCNILGSWNSEIIGLRFDIGSGAVDDDDMSAAAAATAAAGTTTAALPQSGSRSPTMRSPPVNATAATVNATATTTTNSSGSGVVVMHDLIVRLFDHNPPKRNPLMDTNWTCAGRALHTVGGPFALIATAGGHAHDKALATFTGVCKMCGGAETIFGTWNIVRPLRDCRDLQTALETRRDIFRRDLLSAKKHQRLEELRVQQQQQQQQLQLPATNDNRTAGVDGQQNETTTVAHVDVPSRSPRKTIRYGRRDEEQEEEEDEQEPEHEQEDQKDY